MDESSSSKRNSFGLDLERFKRQYRQLVFAAGQVDKLSTGCKNFQDLFTTELIRLRESLKSAAEKLIINAPFAYGRKAEEFFWRKGCYDIIQMAKKNKKKVLGNEELETMFMIHLASASSFILRLIFKIHTHFELDMHHLLDFLPDPRDMKQRAKPRDISDDEKEWAIQMIHRCIIYLGDLARYQLDFDKFSSDMSHEMAERYYLMALYICPGAGMPWNQLGTLIGSRNQSVDAAYYYMQCVFSPSPFEGAAGNLQRIFEKNRESFTSFRSDTSSSSSAEVTFEQKRNRDLKRFLVDFLHMGDIFWNKANNTPSQEMQEICQRTLQEFNDCMFYTKSAGSAAAAAAAAAEPQRDEDEPRSSSSKRVHHLDEDLVFKVVIMSVMCVHRLKGGNVTFAMGAVAFCLALFSHLLNHIAIRLQTSFYELISPPQGRGKLEETETDTADEDVKKLSVESATTSGKKLKDDKKRKVRRVQRRRRRRRGGSDEEEVDEHEGNSDDASSASDLSEGAGEDGGEVGFLSDSSTSSDDNNLMVSQRMATGFLGSFASRDQEATTSLSEIKETKEPTVELAAPLAAISSRLNSSGITEGSSQLTEKSIATFADFSNLFTSRPGSESLFSSSSGAHDNYASDDDFIDNATFLAVLHGKKQVSVPPGFSNAPQTRHVAELVEKMANFVIDTDTDTSVKASDTEKRGAPYESTDSDGDATTETEAESTADRSERDSDAVRNVVRLLQKEPLLICVKVFCDWLLCNQKLIQVCSVGSHSLWSRLAVLLNFLPTEKDLSDIGICQSQQILELITKSTQTKSWNTNPLREDVHLKSFAPLHLAHANLNFDPKTRVQMNEEQETLVRICCMRRFGYLVASLQKTPNYKGKEFFTYDPEKAMFIGQLQLKTHAQQSAAKSSAASNSNLRRMQLMKDMAQLRLQAEVSQLEGTLKSDEKSYSPFLVPDTSALCENLLIVQKLAAASRFIIIIPLTVIDHLDSSKKDSKTAREAIRWLEIQFRQGNRFIRAQKNHERVQDARISPSRKKDVDAWRFHQLIDCCKFLNQQHEGERTDAGHSPSGMVTLLTSHSIGESTLPAKIQDAVKAAMSQGIQVENIVVFHQKWEERGHK